MDGGDDSYIDGRDGRRPGPFGYLPSEEVLKAAGGEVTRGSDAVLPFAVLSLRSWFGLDAPGWGLSKLLRGVPVPVPVVVVA